MEELFKDRLQFDGDVADILHGAAEELGLGTIEKSEPITMGFEDYNVKVTTGKGVYVFKLFSKKRTQDEIERNASIIEVVCAAGIAHPTVYRTTSGSVLYRHTSGVQLVAMDFVDGQSFYEMGVPPNDEQLEKIVAEAVKINKLDLHPAYLFDSWAIPNMQWMYDQTKEHLSKEGERLVGKAFERYGSLPFDALPKAFVHGDIIKTNTLLDKNGKIYIIDFSVANVYPRIQELAVMSANLLFDEKHGKTATLRERVEKLIAMYEKNGGELSDIEKRSLFDYALPVCAMEYMGSVFERIKTGENEEILYWENLGFKGLKQSLES